MNPVAARKKFHRAVSDSAPITGDAAVELFTNFEVFQRAVLDSLTPDLNGTITVAAVRRTFAESLLGAVGNCRVRIRRD